MTKKPFDIFIIGGGINGCGIARDAAGRGLSVALAEMNDLASGTSSTSTKLFHGGLRYLEFFEFRLVREALKEREVLLSAMPHIAWPMRFVLPFHKDMRFDSETPTSRLLSLFMPWMKGRRPAWLIRFGLFLYDHLGGRKYLPATATLDLTTAPEGVPLQDQFKQAYEYSDCWVQDARLVVLNARDAAERGAKIMTRSKVISARKENGLWRIEVETADGPQVFTAKILINAGGPWVSDVLRQTLKSNNPGKIRLVRGSHIVVPKLHDHDKAYFFQGTDGRIIFAIPYEQEFTLIGTTEAAHDDPSEPPVCSDEERDYLINFASQYFKATITAEDVVWTYSGVRPLYEDGAKSATAATREYVLTLEAEAGPPLLNIFGGKITTYRKLAEAALEKLAPHLPKASDVWTAGAPLPGGDFPIDGFDTLVAQIHTKYPFLSEPWSTRLARLYGTEAFALLGDAETADDLGQHFGATITARELDWAREKEWVQTAEDFLWRRGKLGLRVSAHQVEQIEKYLNSN